MVEFEGASIAEGEENEEAKKELQANIDELRSVLDQNDDSSIENDDSFVDK